MRGPVFLFAILILSFFTPNARAESPFLEGNVFDTDTGAPLRSVEVLLSTEGSLGTAVARPVYTDSHGFYSIQVPEQHLGESLLISATCRTRRNQEIREVRAGETHSLLVRSDTMRRDL